MDKLNHGVADFKRQVVYVDPHKFEKVADGDLSDIIFKQDAQKLVLKEDVTAW